MMMNAAQRLKKFADNPGDPEPFVGYLTVRYGGRIRAARLSLPAPVRAGRRQQKGEE